MQRQTDGYISKTLKSCLKHFKTCKFDSDCGSLIFIKEMLLKNKKKKEKKKKLDIEKKRAY